ncbi:pathogenesis-related protein 5-like [Tasmannia lanceolata]|uniref:pathogenesis-related protein 5-like n=1 Tax=Tasmannia lanceolata TaxID=3420 RepID=UPI004062A795
MAILQWVPLLLALFLLGNEALATVFILQNSCDFTIWPGTITANGPINLAEGGFTLQPGEFRILNAPPGWSGRFWARTNCNFHVSGTGRCTTGDCGLLTCTGGAVPPVTLAEFTLNGADGNDFYDVSLVDGYNVGILITPTGGTGSCQIPGCQSDLNESCPPELQIVDLYSGNVVGCKSACEAFKTDAYCCTGDHGLASTCSPTHYSQIFKQACPKAYSYAYDDATSMCTCSGTDYNILFCPFVRD